MYYFISQFEHEHGRILKNEYDIRDRHKILHRKMYLLFNKYVSFQKSIFNLPNQRIYIYNMHYMLTNIYCKVYPISCAYIYIYILQN